jgi:hypothetical protein
MGGCLPKTQRSLPKHGKRPIVSAQKIYGICVFPEQILSFLVIFNGLYQEETKDVILGNHDDDVDEDKSPNNTTNRKIRQK